MKPQKECIYEHKDMVMYRTTCECNYTDHDITFTILYEKDFDEVKFYMETTLTKSYWIKNWSNRWKRIKSAFKLLFFGEISMSQEFIFRNDDHIHDIGNLLVNWKKEVNEYSSDQENKESK